MKHGRGRFKYIDGSIYEGEYYKNLKCGEGILLKADRSIKYEGEWHKNLPNGYGKYYKTNNQVIKGNF